MPNHVEVKATELFNGSTANTEQMHRSIALKVKIAIRTSVKSSFQVGLWSFHEWMAQNEDLQQGARHDNTREIELAKELYAPNGRITDTETKQPDSKD